MKIFSQRKATFVAFAGIAYFASTPSVLGQRAGDAADPIGQHTFNALNNDYHHHHRLIGKKVHLVCNGEIIDTLKCPFKVCGAIAANVEGFDSNSVDASSSTFSAKNNGEIDPIPQVYIEMDCSKKPLKGWATDVPMTNQDVTEPTEETDDSEETDESEEANDSKETDDSEDSDTIELAKKDNAADTDFEASNHGAGHKHKHHHNKNCHHDKEQHNHKNKHPWRDLCVAEGHFCGSSLFGCDFDHKTWYHCSAIGACPTVIEVNAEKCGGPPPVKCADSCKCKDTKDVCGWTFPPECKDFDKNTIEADKIYTCTKDALPKPTTNKCNPGQCTETDVGNAMCEDPCKCKDNRNICGSGFPDTCTGIVADKTYTCAQEGADPVLAAIQCSSINKKCAVVLGAVLCQ